MATEHHPDCASFDRLHDPGPEGEGAFDERGWYHPPCDCERNLVDGPLVHPGLAHDVQALRDLAQRYREVSRRNLGDENRLLPYDSDPGPHMTALQLEWAAREIERLRETT